LNNFTQRLLSFFYLGIFLVLFITGILIFSWLLLAGAAIGLLLFLFSWIRDNFFGTGKNLSRKKSENPGQIIEHDDIK